MLAELREQKADHGAEVFVFGILGVPEDYVETGVLTYAQGPMADDVNSFQARFGIAPGCTTQWDDGRLGEAVPPVRTRAVIESPLLASHNQIYSICGNDFGAALRSMARAVTTYSL